MIASRSPSQSRTPRMERLARLPVFFGLDGKPVIVAGGSAAAAWKAELLSAAGATVRVFAADCGDEMRALAADPPGGAVAVTTRDWQAEDFAGAAMAIGAFDDESDAARFAEAARATGVPVNVVDKPAFCDFSFGAIVNRSPLVIGISTDGAAPVFAKAIRAKLEALIPRGFAGWADAARRWRSRLQATNLSFASRRRFWELFTARAVAEADRAPAEDDYQAVLAATAQDVSADRGSVVMVGAGPGDPELLTLRAVRAMQSADVILIDDLVSAGVLDYARREAKKMMVGKTARGPSCKQSEINDLMVSLAKAGKRVVRLKGGDPMIFGRATEEIEACRAAGIPIEVVPGISAAQGAASRLQVSLTHRNLARRVQYVTGHAVGGKLPDDIDWPSIADATATTVVYMGTRTIAEFVRHAEAHGLDPSTPTIAVANATRPDEARVFAPLTELPTRLEAAKLQGPVLILIGASLAGVEGDRADTPAVMPAERSESRDPCIPARRI